MKSILSIATIIIAILVIYSCREPARKPDKIRIALSKGSPDTSYANYYNWVKNLDSSAVCIDLYAIPIDSALELFKTCSGLIVTGGTDISPAYYNKAFDTVRCWPIDNHRDQLEIRLIDSAISWVKPILGICRGHQMLNVALGGSLIVDIPEDKGTAVLHQCEDYLTCFHPVRLDQRSMLYSITQLREGMTNTNHHQAVNDLAPVFKASAYSSDGLIEALEWQDTLKKPFLIGVQWHPERMDLDNPLSGKLGRCFLEECRMVRH